MPKLGLFLDEDVHAELSIALRKRGFDTIHAQEINRKGLTDLEQLTFAAETKKCLFSFNVKDFALLHNEFISNNKQHYGIILSKQLRLSEVLYKLLSFLQNNTADSLSNKIFFI